MNKLEYATGFENVMQCLLSKDNYLLSCSIIQKLNWNIDDLNYLIKDISSRKDIVYFIVLSDWIIESCTCIYNLYSNYAKYFEYDEEANFQSAKMKFKALRSFVVAHPLKTNRHEKFGYNGDKKCIDINLDLSFALFPLNSGKDDSDFYLSYYAQDAQIAYMTEGHKFDEIYDAVYYSIEHLNEFAKHLSKIRKKDLQKYNKN